MERVEWESLPPAVRDAVQEHIGAVVKIEPIPEGKNSALVAVAHTSTDRVFLKGARACEPAKAAQLEREAAINPYVTAIAPALAFEAAEDGWHLLGFEYVCGHRADYAPGSPDLPKVLETLDALDRLPCPQGGVQLPWFEARLSNYAPPQHLRHFTGRALLHTDLTPGNMRVTPQGAMLVDWATASRGADWVNPADLVLCLIACGHTPRDAEAAVTDVTSWRNADPEAINAYARTTAATWLELYFTATHPWARAAVKAAQQWAMHRWETS
ncbi:hypothetical protein SAMN04489712_104153 [Thermomonospora echinospora]|uniref:Phosphotransferase enzyme family protein n=1 Tax=Thermomonospora echinospora TaxID=1992 RepID=A0A1H5YRW5_9ACTN|nr:aminoglycoside phosphotransferase [Thermomonospora echinospora]SEG26873.1 hypothetical protein SAMN04489712_104153 [Thermomonospora echinospora]